jgi:hypothetical protein
MRSHRVTGRTPLARKRKRGLRLPGVVGAGIGLLLGGRLVKAYDWCTEWFVSAPLPVVYEALISWRAVREWWPSMELVEDGSGDELRTGSTVRFRVHQAPEVARPALWDPLPLHRRGTGAAGARGRLGGPERRAGDPLR